ncbi:LacI family transcriptional regulator [Alkalihalobacillus oceani]|uniref:LacI family transcriptional regulator n=1 Tax=Halalkalibacter oceani TaxID=1653776 RepID=A0A9X2DRK9_9BACI|nr:LacI family DNA-binding transcriptional regulator [Halalkalibacter oceani]MCM3715749.1 LacI family transcriptional regulator [Halalkalibacter oceani]
MKKNKVTIKDVAKHAGVGIGTVSRAINGSGEINAETKLKVFKSIQDLGYTPNRIARSMRTKQYKQIALFVNISNVAFTQIANGISQYLDTVGYSVSLCNVGDDEDVRVKILAALENQHLDGIIIAPPREDNLNLSEIVNQMGIPIVTMDRDIPGIPAGVYTDYFTSVNKAVQYLLSLGHRGIALIGGSHTRRQFRKSKEGYEQAFIDSGIENTGEGIIIESDLSSQGGKKAMNDLLPKIRNGTITAIFSLNHYIFHGVLQVIRDNHLRYPEDISIITFEDYELTHLLDPPVTVIRRPLNDIGYSVAQILIRYINEPELYGKIEPFRIPTEFIIRESCGFLKRQ